MINRALKAKQLYEEGWSCSQAILMAWADEFGLEPTLASRLADPLSGGMAGTGEMCGAIGGALLVIGLAQGRVSAGDLDVKQRCRNTAKHFIEEFRSQYGEHRCDHLVPQTNRSREEVLAEQHKLCPGIVLGAADILSRILSEEGLTR